MTASIIVSLIMYSIVLFFTGWYYFVSAFNGRDDEKHKDYQISALMFQAAATTGIFIIVLWEFALKN